MQKRKIFHALALSLLTLVVTGCSIAPPGSSLRRISLKTSRDCNMSTAITVDLVVFYDKDLFESVKKMDAHTYFHSVDQVRRDNESLIEIWRWELVPNQILENYKPVFKQGKAWGVLIFADYKTKGTHRAGIGSEVKSAFVSLGKTDFLSIDTSNDRPSTSEAQVEVYPVSQTILLDADTPLHGSSDSSSDAEDG